MNDLAEKALQGLDVARKEVAGRPVLSLSVSGFLAAAVIVVAGGRLGAAPAAIPLTTWLGLLPRKGPQNDALYGSVMTAAIVGLILLWLLTLRIFRTSGTPERRVWAIAGAWSLPFVVGPPLLSTDVYSSVAHGLLARAGLDPYVHAPVALGSDRIVDAINPTWRSTSSTGGPLSTLTEHLAVAVSGGSPLGAVIMLRALAVVSAIAIGMLAADLAGPRRAAALCITVLNPAVLLYVVSGAHLEGLLGALLLGALVAASQRRWLIAVVLACAAAGVKPVALIAVLAVIAMHAVGQRTHIAWRIAVRDLVWAAASLTVFVFVVSDGLGWARNMSTAMREHTPFSPASLVSDLISPIVPSASFDDLATGGRIAVILAAVTVVAYLLTTVRDRPLDRTIGFSLLAAGLLSPVLYPWFPLWGLLCLAPTAGRARRDWVIALSAACCVLTPAGFGDGVSDAITGGGMAVIVCVLVPRLVIRQRATAAARRVTAAE